MEQAWTILTASRLETINALPPNLIYTSASKTAQELVPPMREQGAELIIALTHQREPNDQKLAQNMPPGLVDIVLGGHDHYYAHEIINSTHVLRSGSDFKQLSYIQAWRKTDGPGWDFDIIRRDMFRSIPEDPPTVKLAAKLTSSLRAKLDKPVGYTVRPLDARFSTVRCRESNLCNFVCDLMHYYYAADCGMMAGGTVRGDQVYPPGLLRLKDILNCFPFEDPVVVVRARGKAIMDALENGVSKLPALDGRFAHVSNIAYGFNPTAPPGSRITWAKMGGRPIDLDRPYALATRGYMSRGKDGFTSLLVQPEGGEVEEIVSEEDGLLISTIIRQYFQSLKIMGTWQFWSPSLKRHWGLVHKNLHGGGWLKPPSTGTSPVSEKVPRRPQLRHMNRYYYGRFPEADVEKEEEHDETMDSDSDEDPDVLTSPQPTTNYVTQPARSGPEEERRMRLARLVTRMWMRRAGLKPSAVNRGDDEMEFTPAWTSGISPGLEGRIVNEGDEVDGL